MNIACYAKMGKYVQTGRTEAPEATITINGVAINAAEPLIMPHEDALVTPLTLNARFSNLTQLWR